MAHTNFQLFKPPTHTQMGEIFYALFDTFHFTMFMKDNCSNLVFFSPVGHFHPDLGEEGKKWSPGIKVGVGGRNISWKSWSSSASIDKVHT